MLIGGQSVVPSVVAVVVMALITVSAIVLITVLLPDRDNTALIAQIFTITTPTTFALLAYLKAQETYTSVKKEIGRREALEAKKPTIKK